MIVAITGGTGFIGKHLIARHVVLGDQVRFLTRRKTASDILGAVAHTGNLCSSPDELRQFVRGADVLYHCAAELRNEAEMASTNVHGTSNLLTAATGEIGRWVQLSSAGIYGSVLHGEIDEDTEISPGNEYEKTKAQSDELVLAAAVNQRLPCIVLRPSNVYGIDMPNQSLLQLIGKIDKGMFFFIGKPGAVANYIHIENVIDAMLLCGTAGLPINGRAYIVSDHRTMERFIDIIASALGKHTPQIRLPESLVRAATALTDSIPKFPLKSSRVDALTNRVIYRTGRIESELGYKNRISMEEGIGELTRYWKNGST